MTGLRKLSKDPGDYKERTERFREERKMWCVTEWRSGKTEMRKRKQVEFNM